MARPMLLMNKDMLTTLHIRFSQGVPVLKLIRQFNLELHITAPTLSKLLSYKNAMLKSQPEVSQIIEASLFPEWLDKAQPTKHNRVMFNDKLAIASSPSNWYYTGKMPLGQWKQRELT